MRRLFLPLFLLLTLGLSGCYYTSYRTNLPPGPFTQEIWENYFLFGLIGEPTVDLEAACPHGVAEWNNHATFLNGFLALITLYIYTPRTVVIRCAP